ncbi:bifunctional glutamate N-acetyltransferase/amino-acid acetyltransferase ArgJ [Aliiroseovarius sp.]|uniref:bifunctional glutamate N-acetyltransferase/amino-acid acetyltransferase ArgJ n=1 Tax=Aliiroseovarius sp. TaxID=1872442 RepID=UPI0026025CA5|nr:bifunctional glutamate N-acetyltransferase/amino-acid acetyltransferase ArgJ [Aliiroseovarius sp.]
MGAKAKIKKLEKRLKKLKAKLKAATTHTHAVAPLAPAGFPALPVIAGARFSAVKAGVKYADRLDVMLAELQPGTAIAGVFTKSSTRSAAVLDCQDKIGSDPAAGAAIIVNAGNSNAFTGQAGFASVAKITGAVADRIGVPENRVYSASTGVIGEPLDPAILTDCLDELQGTLVPDSLEQAAEAIRTTDTFAKGAKAEVRVGDRLVHIAGIAKGSGMIAPDMATMLVFIFTDAKIDQPVLQQMLGELTDQTFNNITVDSDTSTSDTLIVAATGASDVGVDADHAGFRKALRDVMMDLAHQVVRDGEGATKFVEVRVTGARTDADARTHALAIANSPLVKTAVAGEDPNWGRIVAAIGKSGAYAERDRLSISFGNILVAEGGWVSPAYREEDGAHYMKHDELLLHVDMGLDAGNAQVWTCDLTHGYIQINADYRS